MTVAFWFLFCFILFLIHGFKQQYPRMSLEWILDKPLALGLGPHPHLLSACSLLLFSLSQTDRQTHAHTHKRRLQKHYRHSCQFNKERLCHAYLSHSFLARVTTVWVSGKTGRGQADYRSTSGQWIGLCMCVCWCLCVCVEACACAHIAYVLTRQDKCSAGHCSTFRRDGGVTQKRCPGQEGELAVSWWGCLAVSAGVGAGYGSTINNRPHDGKTSGGHMGNIMQAQSFWYNSIMHGFCFLDSTTLLRFWRSLRRMDIWKCKDL